MVDVKNEFVNNLDRLDNNEITEEHNPWQSSRPSIPRDEPRETSQASLPDHLTRSSHKLIPPPPPPPPPPPIQPPSSLDSHHVYERDQSESIQDDEIQDIHIEYDQILQKPRTSRASSRVSYRNSRGPSLDKLTQHQKQTIIVRHDDDNDNDNDDDSENTDSDSYDTHTPTSQSQSQSQSENTDDTTIIYQNENAGHYEYNKVIEVNIKKKDF